MQRDALIQNMLAAGLDSAVAEKAVKAGFTLTKLRGAAKKDLKTHFYPGEIDQISQRLQRKPIDDAVVLELVEKCDWSCCMCWDLDERNPIIIHHIVEHSKTADDSYPNLAVLCLNHHATAHTTSQISQPVLPPDMIRTRKAAFELAIVEFKAGKRAAPGREGDGSDPASQSDVEALRRISGFLSRPAVSRRFQAEGNMQDFLTAMADVMRTLNAGVMKTREGDDLGRTKTVRQFSNPNWREKMGLSIRPGLVITFPTPPPRCKPQPNSQLRPTQNVTANPGRVLSGKAIRCDHRAGRTRDPPEGTGHQHGDRVV